jgi:hypothetical protein
MFTTALAISLTGVIYFLLALVVLCFLIVGVRYLLGLAGIALPQPMWALIAFALFLIVLLYALGAFGGGGGVTLR